MDGILTVWAVADISTSRRPVDISQCKQRLGHMELILYDQPDLICHSRGHDHELCVRILRSSDCKMPRWFECEARKGVIEVVKVIDEDMPRRHSIHNLPHYTSTIISLDNVVSRGHIQTTGLKSIRQLRSHMRQ